MLRAQDLGRANEAVMPTGSGRCDPKSLQRHHRHPKEVEESCLQQKSSEPRVGVHAFRQGDLHTFGTRLIYTISSRTAEAAQREPVSNKQPTPPPDKRSHLVV